MIHKEAEHRRVYQRTLSKEVMILKKLILILLSTILLLTSFIYMSAMTIERTILNSEYYHNILEETNLVTTIHDFLKEEIPKKTMGPEATEQGIPQEIEELLLESFFKAFDAIWLEETIITIADDLIDLIAGNEDTIHTEIDIQPQKALFALYLYDGLEELSEVPQEEANLMIVELTEELPDTITVTELVNEQEVNEALAILQTFREYRQAFPYVIYILFTVIFIFYLLLAGYKKGLKGFGAIAMIAGALFLISLQIAQKILIPVIINDITEDIDPQILTSILEITTTHASTIPLIFLGGGLLFFIPGVILAKTRERESP